jgi:hypothetical protein
VGFLFKNYFMIQKTLFVTALSLLFGYLLSAQDIQWEKSYGGRQAEYLFDAQPTADYGFILAGSSLSQKTGNKTEAAKGDLDYWVWKMDENGNEDWQKSFGGSGSDLLVSIKNTNDGGFILGGISNSSKDFDKKEDGRGGNDFWIVKLNAKGAEEWQKTFGGSGQDDLVSISPTRDGGYIIGGSSASDNTGDKKAKSCGNMDYWIIKTDSEGNEQWQKTFGGKYADMLKSVIPTADGGYIVGGSSNSPGSRDKASENYGEGSDYWILKLDDKGEVAWQQTLGGDKDDQLYAVIQAHNGDFLLGGYSNSGATGTKSRTNRQGSDFWIIRLDDAGNTKWQETYDFGKTDILTSILENEDHSLLIGGFAQSESTKDSEGTNDYIAMKISETGEKLWDRTVGSEGTDILRKAIETRDGGYLLAGTSNPEEAVQKEKSKSSLDNGQNIAGAERLNESIDKNVNEATDKVNGLYEEQAKALTDKVNPKEDSDNPVKLGLSAPESIIGAGKKDGNTLDSLGKLASQSGAKPGLAASRDKKTNLGNNDFWVVKLKDKDKKAKAAKAIEAFPNPTQKFTNVIVGFDYNKGNIAVYDLSGRQLQNYKVSDRTIPVDLGNYPEGVYIVKVATDKGEASMKIIKGIQ